MIDISTLTIGSHVLFNGERVRITVIDESGFIPFVKTDVNHYSWLQPKELDPIPITDELLLELGFRCKYSSFYKDLNSNLCLSYNSYKAFIVWEVRNGEFINDLSSMENLCYLHELEAFVYLTTKLKLIEK